MLRLDLDRNAEMVAPSGQFLEPVRLALRRAFGQWEAAGVGENLTEIDRVNAERGAMRAGHGLDPRRAHMGPGGIERGIVVDVNSHKREPSVRPMILREAGNLGKALVMLPPCVAFRAARGRRSRVLRWRRP